MDPEAIEAIVYDLTTTEVSAGDVPFYAALAADARVGLLELGCGTGRVLVPCAAACDVPAWGVDRSAPMLARARASAAAAGIADRVTLVAADIRDARLGVRADLATAPFRVLLELPSDADWLAALATARAHLVPGGLFAADVFVPDPARLAGRPLRRAGTVIDDDLGVEIRLTEGRRLDPVTGAVVLERGRKVRAGDGRRIGYRADIAVTFRQPAEVLRLVAEAGFEVVGIFGGFDGSAFTERADELVLVARLPA